MNKIHLRQYFIIIDDDDHRRDSSIQLILYLVRGGLFKTRDASKWKTGRRDLEIVFMYGRLYFRCTHSNFALLALRVIRIIVYIWNAYVFGNTVL